MSWDDQYECDGARREAREGLPVTGTLWPPVQKG